MTFPQIVRCPETHREITLVGPNMTVDGRTVYGFKWASIMRLAARWWDRRIAPEMSRLSAEWRDPDVGFASGITRGLPWSELGGDERVKVAMAYEEQVLRERHDVRGALLEYMVVNHPDLLNKSELAKYVAALPDAGRLAGASLQETRP